MFIDPKIYVMYDQVLMNYPVSTSWNCCVVERLARIGRTEAGQVLGTYDKLVIEAFELVGANQQNPTSVEQGEEQGLRRYAVDYSLELSQIKQKTLRFI